MKKTNLIFIISLCAIASLSIAIYYKINLKQTTASMEKPENSAALSSDMAAPSINEKQPHSDVDRKTEPPSHTESPQPVNGDDTIKTAQATDNNPGDYFYLGTDSPYPNLLKKDVKLIGVSEDGITQYAYKDELIITITPDGDIYYLPNEI